jgi:signal transduction histidine kinase
MSKKWTLIWLTLIFSLFLILAIYSFHKNNPLLLISSEIVIPLLYTATISILLKSLKPISAIGRSLNLLKEGDFNITMITTGNKDVDNIIDVYNSMILGYGKNGYQLEKKIIFLICLLSLHLWG